MVEDNRKKQYKHDHKYTVLQRNVALATACSLSLPSLVNMILLKIRCSLNVIDALYTVSFLEVLNLDYAGAG